MRMSTKRSGSAGILIAFLSIGTFGAILRLWNLDGIPGGIYGDEAFNGVDALTSLQDGLQPFYPGNGGREGLLIWLIAATHSVMEPGAFALRLPSAIAGSATVFLLPMTFLALMRFFRIGRDDNQAFNVVVAAGAAMFFLAASFWHLNVSRIAFRAILDPLFAALALLLICLALVRSRNAVLGCIAGAATGLGLYGYGTFKFMVFPILVLLVHAILQQRPRVLRQISVMAASVVVTASPLLYFIAMNPAAYFHRLASISVWRTDSPILEFLQSNLILLQMFFAVGDRNPRHNLNAEPQVHAILFAFFIIGVVFFVYSWREKRIGDSSRRASGKYGALGAFLLVYWASMLVPASIVYEPGAQPHALRSIGLVLPTIMVSAIGAAFSAAFLLRTSSPRATVALACGIAAIIGTNTALDYHSRFPGQSETAEAFDLRLTESARKLVQGPPDTRKLIVLEERDSHNEYWRLKQFFYLSGNDLESHNTTMAQIDDLRVWDGLEGAWIFVPPALEGALSHALKERNEIIPY